MASLYGHIMDVVSLFVAHCVWLREFGTKAYGALNFLLTVIPSFLYLIISPLSSLETPLGLFFLFHLKVLVTYFWFLSQSTTDELTWADHGLFLDLDTSQKWSLLCSWNFERQPQWKPPNNFKVKATTSCSVSVCWLYLLFDSSLLVMRYVIVIDVKAATIPKV